MGLIVFGVIALLGVLILYFIYDPSEIGFFPKCPFYSATGIYCPGCGSQRAIRNILHFNIIAGIKHNFLIIMLFAVLAYEGALKLLSITLKKKFKNILHYSITTNIILIVVILFWLLRNITKYPFSELAP